jgi:hypothetical protein
MQPKIVKNVLETLESKIPKYKDEIRFVQFSFTIADKKPLQNFIRLKLKHV